MFGEGPAGTEREADAGVAIGGDGLTVVRCPEQVDARGHGPVEKVRVGEAEVDQGAQGADRHAKPKFLAFAEKIALPQRDVAQHAGGGRVARTEGDVARTLLYHLNLQVGLV